MKSWVLGHASTTVAVVVGVGLGCSQGSQSGTDTASQSVSSDNRGGGQKQPPPRNSNAHDPGPRPGPVGAGAPATPQPIDPDSSTAQAAAAVACFPGLRPPNLLACEQAVIRLQEVDSVGGKVGTESGAGLGPTFNGNSCTMCHGEPAPLGSSPGLNSPQNSVPNPQVALATLDSARNTIPPFITAAGPVREVRFQSDNGVHDIFTIAGRVDASGCRATQPDFASQAISFRIPTPLFGLGLVENTPDATLQTNLASSSAQFDTGGTFNTSGNDGTITRFGWKAQNKSLMIFVSEAYNVEQGVSNELFPQERTGGAGNLQGCLGINPTPEDVSNLASMSTLSDGSSDAFNFALGIRLSKPPTPASGSFSVGNTAVASDTVARGASQFAAVGCANCHTPSLTTAESSIDPAMSNVTYHPYSDFAIHHMGAGLSDGITQGNAGPDQFRTAPLWGVGQRLFFLHDGRTTDLVAAIAAHGGDATTVIDKWNDLSSADQQAIVDFLRSL